MASTKALIHLIREQFKKIEFELDVCLIYHLKHSPRFNQRIWYCLLTWHLSSSRRHLYSFIKKTSLMPFVVTVHSLERLKSSANLSLRLVMVQHEPLKVQNIVSFLFIYTERKRTRNRFFSLIFVAAQWEH